VIGSRPVNTGILKKFLMFSRNLFSTVSISSNYSLADAVAWAVANGGGEIVVPVGTHAMSANVTIPASCTLKFVPGAMIDTTGFTLTVNGTIDAGLYQIFTGSGTIALNQFKNNSIYPEWWGAIGDNSTDDTSAIQTCLNYFTNTSMSYYGDLIFTNKYKITDALVIGKISNKNIRGLSVSTTITQFTDDKAIFRLITPGVHDFIIDNLTLTWNTQQTSAHTASIGIEFNDAAGSALSYYRFKISNMLISKCAYGTKITGTGQNPVWSMTMDRVLIIYPAITGIHLVSPTSAGMPNNSFYDCMIWNETSANSSFQIYLDAQTGFQFVNMNMQGNAYKDMVRIVNSYGTFDGLHIENAVFNNPGSYCRAFFISGGNVAIRNVNASPLTMTDGTWFGFVHGEFSGAAAKITLENIKLNQSGGGIPLMYVCVGTVGESDVTIKQIQHNLTSIVDEATTKRQNVHTTPIRSLQNVTFAEIAAGAYGTVALTVTGALALDQAIASPPTALEAGLILMPARVTAANTVTITLYNSTVGAITPAVAYWGIAVGKF
jgi:hypothetical protein